MGPDGVAQILYGCITCQRVGCGRRASACALFHQLN
ncbi:UBP-type zinc finger domain-containing protein [Caballeronia sp. SBC2]